MDPTGKHVARDYKFFDEKLRYHANAQLPLLVIVKHFFGGDGEC